MLKKLVTIGDSLALPGHLNKYEDTWYHKLKQHFSNIDIIPVFRRSITTDILVSSGGGESGIDTVPSGADCLEFYMPQYIILQLGIVDCAPRMFARNSLEYRLIQKLPNRYAKKYIDVTRKLRSRDSSKVLVTPDKFKFNLELFLNRCKETDVKKIVIIGIPFPDKRMLQKNPLIGASVEKYNGIFEELMRDFSNVEIKYPLDSRLYAYSIFEDGYHPNATGHDLIFKCLMKTFDFIVTT